MLRKFQPMTRYEVTDLVIERTSLSQYKEKIHKKIQYMISSIPQVGARHARWLGLTTVDLLPRKLHQSQDLGT